MGGMLLVGSVIVRLAIVVGYWTVNLLLPIGDSIRHLLEGP